MNGAVGCAHCNFITNLESHHLSGVFRDQRPTLRLGIAAFRQHVGKDFRDAVFICAEDYDLFSTHGIAEIGAKIQRAIRGEHRNIGPDRHQSGILGADVFQPHMPVAIIPLGLQDLTADKHVRHTENGGDQEHRQDDTDDRHPALLPMDLFSDGDKIKIVFHPKSLPDPSTRRPPPETHGPLRRSGSDYG